MKIKKQIWDNIDTIFTIIMVLSALLILKAICSVFQVLELYYVFCFSLLISAVAYVKAKKKPVSEKFPNTDQPKYIPVDDHREHNIITLKATYIEPADKRRVVSAEQIRHQLIDTLVKDIFEKDLVKLETFTDQLRPDVRIPQTDIVAEIKIINTKQNI